jgi:hypothetical protein
MLIPKNERAGQDEALERLCRSCADLGAQMRIHQRQLRGSCTAQHNPHPLQASPSDGFRGGP